MTQDSKPRRSLSIGEYLIRIGGAVVVTYAAFGLAVVESFTVPFRIGGVLVPVAAVGAIAGNIVLPRLMLYLARHRGLALLPGLVWFVVVLIAASPTGESDLIITSGWPGMALLLSGAATIACVGYLIVTRTWGPGEASES